MRAKMNREQAIERLKELHENDDVEEDHAIADEVLCSLLKSLGFEDVVAEYQKLPRYFS